MEIKDLKEYYQAQQWVADNIAGHVPDHYKVRELADQLIHAPIMWDLLQDSVMDLIGYILRDEVVEPEGWRDLLANFDFCNDEEIGRKIRERWEKRIIEFVEDCL